MSGDDRSGYGSDRFDRNDRSERDYRPMAGDYGRSGQFRGGGDDERGRFGRSRPIGNWQDDDRFDRSRDDNDRFGRSRPVGNWNDDDPRRTSFAGSRDRSEQHDPHYNQWRERQLSELDRDYDEYHRERQSRFEDDFGSWRERRQQKRQTVSQVREHMEVVGKDGEHVGTVDKTAGDRIILTRSNPDAGGAHHSISCNDVDCIEDNKVRLDCTADEARKRWRNEDRSRALFERHDQGEEGPHILDRSFSGTYRD